MQFPTGGKFIVIRWKAHERLSKFNLFKDKQIRCKSEADGIVRMGEGSSWIHIILYKANLASYSLPNSFGDDKSFKGF